MTASKSTMKLSAGALAALLIPALAGATPPKVDRGDQEFREVAAAGKAKAAFLAYQPPLRGATEGGRVGGGTRGLGDQPVTIDVLAPDHTGLTVSEQPTLYWFVSKRIDQPAELTIIDDKSIEPLVDIKLTPPIEAGIHSLSLAEHGVQLEPGVPYQWFVAVVVDPTQRSNDVIAGGEIQRVSASDTLRSDLGGAGEDQRPAVFAQAGIWYDALDGVSTLIERHPGDAKWKELRAALLEQVGLEKAAAYERGGQ